MHQSKVCVIHQLPIQGDILILVHEDKKTICQRSRFTQDSPQGRERYSFKPENMLLYYLAPMYRPSSKTVRTAACIVYSRSTLAVPCRINVRQRICPRRFS